MAIFVVFSVTAANAAITVPEDKPIYPAVYQAIQNGHKSVWSESKIANITDPNTVVSDQRGKQRRKIPIL